MREAPIIRSRPNSRARWATVIESVLKMMNAPTNRAIPPNATSAVLMMSRKLFSPLMSKRSWDSADATSTPGGSTGLMSACSAFGSVPGLPATRIESTVVAALEQLLRALQREHGDRRVAERVDARRT